MDMQKVDRILEEHNKKMDSMTSKERKRYYASYGLRESDAKKKSKTKKYVPGKGSRNK